MDGEYRLEDRSEPCGDDRRRRFYARRSSHG
jgi:hypothetical protein